MPKSHAQLQEKIQALQQKADNARAAAAPYVIRQIKQAVSFYKLTAEDLGLSGPSERSPVASARSAEVSTSKVRLKDKKSAKFRSADGEEWAGRGPRPQWLRTALSQGSTLSDFEVGPGGRTKRGQLSGTAIAPTAPIAAPTSHPDKATLKKRRAANRQTSKSASASATKSVNEAVARRTSEKAVLSPPSTLGSREPNPSKRAATPAPLAPQSEPARKEPTGRGSVKTNTSSVTKPTQENALRQTSAKTKSRKHPKPSVPLERPPEDKVRVPESRGDQAPLDAIADAATTANVSANDGESDQVKQGSGTKPKTGKKSKPMRRAAPSAQVANVAEPAETTASRTPAA